jgi:L-alanine-DL-glutamate epimerase-like enolase superfamily enzyme
MTELTIHWVELPLRYPVRTVKGTLFTRQTVLLQYADASGVFWGEAPARIHGRTHHMTQSTVWSWLSAHGGDVRRYLDDPGRVPNPAEGVSATIQTALDQIIVQRDARQQGCAVHDFLGIAPRPIDGNAMLGMQPTDDAYGQAIERIAAQGYRGLKLKVTPNTLAIMNRVIRSVGAPFTRIVVDANESFDTTNWHQLDVLPDWVRIEQPVSAAEPDLLRRMSQRYPHRIIVDESIRRVQDMALFAGLPIGVMIKPSSMGGIRPTVQAIHAAREYGLSCGVSGYLESGVGRYFHWLIAQHPGITLPCDFMWSDYYYTHDVCGVFPGADLYKGLPPIDGAPITASQSV